jgi:hypothetical protein
MWPFTIHQQPPYKPKLYGQRFNNFNPFADCYQQQFPTDSSSMRFSNYVELPGSNDNANANASLQQLLQGLAPAPTAPPAAAALPAVLPPALPGPLNHPIPA